MNKILIVEARFYQDIAEELLSGAKKVVVSRDFSVEKIEVPGVFEIPSAVAKAWAKSWAHCDSSVGGNHSGGTRAAGKRWREHNGVDDSRNGWGSGADSSGTED